MLLVPCTAPAEEWPQWRGPRGDGTSHETGLPLRWSTTENVRWKVAVPGTGHSSPVVWGDRIFLSTCLEKERQRLLLCFDRVGGKLLWQRVVVTAPLEQKHFLNSYASSTPATDGRHVWVTFEAAHQPNQDVEQLTEPRDFPDLVVACYDMDGRLMWRRSPGKFRSKHGFCSPPIPYKDTIIVNGDQDAEAYLVALDKDTGAERWRTDRPNRTRSYCPPLIIDYAGRKQLVLSGSKCAASYDPETGKQNWIVDGPTEQFVASAVYARGVVFITGGFPEHHLIGIRPDGHGNVTKSKVIWHHPRDASYVPSPISDGTYFYVVTDDGKCSCLDARTGKRLWFERLGRHHSASPVSAGGYLYWPDDDGRTFVLRAGPKFQVVARNDLEEECRASPAVAHGEIFIRTLGHLYCIAREDKVQSRR
jgi:outer membrane protein assembly factor BamB